jgi:hypothetical protein
LLWLHQFLKERLVAAVRFIKSIKDKVQQPVKRANRYINEQPWFQSAVRFTDRLQKAIRPILLPYGIALWGVALQMHRFDDDKLGGIWKLVRICLNPVGYVTDRISDRRKKYWIDVERSSWTWLKSFVVQLVASRFSPKEEVKKGDRVNEATR